MCTGVFRFSRKSTAVSSKGVEKNEPSEKVSPYEKLAVTMTPNESNNSHNLICSCLSNSGAENLILILGRVSWDDIVS